MVESILPEADSGIGSRLLLLTGQSFFFGLSLAFLIIPASAIFLTAYGSDKLPYTYIVAAISGSFVSYGLAALQRHWTLSALAITTTVALVAFYFLAWMALSLANLLWVSFILLVVFALFLQIGFVFIGGQAGRLFDVQQIKRLFPRVVSGSAVGFLAGGLLTAPLLNLVGKTENLLLGAIAALLTMVALLIVASRCFPAELNQRESRRHQLPRPPLRKLLTKRFVVLIFLYQMFSAMGTQLVDFMVYDRAALRFTTSQSLVQFFGNFTAILNLTDILFLALAAGFLLSRFGLRFGLTANPAGVGIFVVGLLLSGLLLGPASTLFFVVVTTARIVDLSLSDGATRTSLNTAYQVLLPADRLAVQTSVEGIGVPVALGLTGVILLIFQAIPSLNILHLVMLTLAVTFVWMGAGLLVYRDYAANLLRVIKSRALVPTELVLDDSSSLAVVERLVHSDRLYEVHLGLDMLLTADYATWRDELIALADHPNPQIRRESLRRIEERRVKEALPQVEQNMKRDGDPKLRGAAIRTYAAIHEGNIIETLNPFLDDPDEEARLGAMVGLLRYGGIPGVLAAGERLTVLEHAPDAADRRLAARVISAVGVEQFYQPLLALLQDEDISVRREALIATSQVRHPTLLPLVILNLANRGIRSATMTALTAYEEAILPYVSQALEAETIGNRDGLIRLLQICGQLRGENVIALLKPYVDHPDREVGNHVLSALQKAGYRASGDDARRLNQIVQASIEHGLRILTAQQEIGQEAGLEPLQNALDDEFGLLLRRLFLLLSLLYDAQAILSAERQLTQASLGSHALALEMLEVTLAGEHNAQVLSLVNPKLSRTQRIQQLSKQAPGSSLSRQQHLHELITDPDSLWPHAWLRACAVYGAGMLNVQELAGDIAHLLPTGDQKTMTEPTLYGDLDIVRESAAWALHRIAPEHFLEYTPALLDDPNPLVRHLAAEATKGTE